MDIALTYLGLVCLAKNDFEAVNGVLKDTFFQKAMRIRRMPSEPTLRQRFDEYARDFITCFDRAAIELLIRSQVPITPIPLSDLKHDYVVLDIDGSPFDNSKTKKEGVERTYKGFDGYGGMMAYLAEEGWCVGAELRPGSQHQQFEFDYFLERVLPRAKRLIKNNKSARLLARLDSGHDALSNRIGFSKEQVDYIIKWNPRTYPVEELVEQAYRRKIEWKEERPGKRVAVFTERIENKDAEGPACWRRVIRVTTETTDRKGQPTMFPQTAVEGWWTSLEEQEETVIRLYEKHGTSEQFHSEFKTDLDMERFPSGKFNTNDLVLTAGMLSYNILRIIGQMTLTGDLMPSRHRSKRKRLRTVIEELMYLAARVVHSGRQWALQFSSWCPALKAFEHVYTTLLKKPQLC